MGSKSISLKGASTFFWQTKQFTTHLTLLLIWGLAVFSFSMPGRMDDGSGGSLDAIAATKMLLRVGTVAWFMHQALQCLHARDWGSKSVNRIFAPWCIYLVWAFFSAVWSPLKVATIGQAIGLAAHLSLAWLVAQRFNDADSLRTLAKHLCRLMVVFSAIVLVVCIIFPDSGGLDRDERVDSTDGFVHPTAVGATASLGLVYLVGLYLLRLESWRWFAFGVAVHSTMLLLSQSRAAILCLAVTLPLVQLCFGGWQWIGRTLVIVAACLCVGLILDPGFDYTQKYIDAGLEYIKRGQSSDELAAVSGRAELWEKIYVEFGNSPIIGHGYFVTSAAGKIDVWLKPGINLDAHNIILQVFVTTGIVGGLIFTVAIWRWLAALWAVIVSKSRFAEYAKLLSIISVWYLIWGMGCTTFMGPVRPESVVFFVMLGMTARFYCDLVESCQEVEARHDNH